MSRQNVGDQGKAEEAEARFKKVFSAWRLPEAGIAPASYINAAPRMITQDDLQTIWRLEQDVKILTSKYTLITKIVFRTSAALVGLAAPALGWDFINKLLIILGG